MWFVTKSLCNNPVELKLAKKEVIMGDVGDDYRAWKEIKSEYKQKCLDEADSKGWSKHTPYHWYRDVNGERLDYWPSTRKMMWRGEMYGSDGKNKWYLKLIGETK